MSQAANGSNEHDQQTLQGVTFFWALGLLAMIVIVAVYALGGAASELVSSEIDGIAVGAANGIGLIALGGVNAIGVIAFGMVNAIGVVAIGGVNSIGLISIGGVNSGGVITIGGVNSYRIFWSLWSVTLFVWAPRIR